MSWCLRAFKNFITWYISTVNTWYFNIRILDKWYINAKINVNLKVCTFM